MVTRRDDFATVENVPVTHVAPQCLYASNGEPSTTFVAAMHTDAEVHAVKLRSRIDSCPRHGAVITSFSDVKPSQDMGVVSEPRLPSENETSCENHLVEFERIIIALRW